MFKSSTVEMLRAYLIAASMGAALIDACVVIAMFVFDVPQRVFTTVDFRLAMGASLVLLLLAMRSVANAAFRAAVSSRHATLCQSGGVSVARPVTLRDDCPHRLLVLFHIYINRKRFDFSPA